MTANNEETRQESTLRPCRRLRIAGIVVLLLGAGGAWLVYWLGIRSADVMDDPSMVGFYRAQNRQMGMLYGKMGLAVEQLFDDLKQPSTQAKIIVAVSVIVAAGCFYLARLKGSSDEVNNETNLNPPA
jgi:hypothetical protein